MMKTILVLFSLCITISAGAQKKWSLGQCIDHAIEHNIEIRQRKISRDKQEVDVHTAKYRRLPNLGGRAGQAFGYGRVTSPLDNSYINHNTKNTNFEVATSISLFSGRQISNNISLTKLNLKAGTEDLKKMKEDIQMQVTSYFLQVLFSEEICRVTAGQVKLSEEQYQRIEKMKAIGKVSASTLYEVKSRLAQDKLSAVQAENNRQLAILDLTQLLELPSPEEFAIVVPEMEPDFEVLTLPQEIYNIAVLSRPGVRAAQYRLEGAEKSISIAQGAYYPQLEFAAGISTGYHTISSWDSPSFSDQLDNNLSKSFGLTLSIPIFNRMETRDKVKTARLQQLSQNFQLDNVKKALYKEIQQAYYSAVAARSKYLASATAVETTREASRLIQKKYEQEQATTVEYNEAMTNLLKATSDRIQAKYDYLFRLKILDFYKGIPLKI